jgi:hypothetical protein
MAPIAPVPDVGGVFADQRDGNRWLRVSWHEDEAMFVISTWHQDHCVSAYQLPAADAARLAGILGAAVGSTVAD